MLINEMSSELQNKNMFNKLMHYLNAYSKKIPISDRCVSGLEFVDDLYGATFRINFNTEIKKIYTENCNGWIYFLAEIDTRALKDSVKFQYASGDPALEFIRYYASKSSDDWRYHRTIVEKLEADGLKCHESITGSEIQKSKPYAKLTQAIDELSATRFDTVLQDKVHVRVKTRRNVVPLAFYKEDEDVFNYPYTRLYGGLMSTSCRMEQPLHSAYTQLDFKNIASHTIAYTPYSTWTWIDFSNVSNIVDSDLMKRRMKMR